MDSFIIKTDKYKGKSLIYSIIDVNILMVVDYCSELC